MTRHVNRQGSAELLGLAILLIGGWLVLGRLSSATVTIAVLALYYAVGGLSFNFLQGTLGVFSLAQPVFLLVGGYSDAYLVGRFGISPWVCIPIAMAIAAIIAFPIGLACVRSDSSAILVALVTLIVAEATAPIVTSVPALGGGLGLLINSMSHPSWSDMQFTSPDSFARLLLVVNVILIGGLAWFKRTRWGYWAAAARDSKGAASAVGIPVRKLSLTLFIISAVIVAPAGVIYAQYNLSVTTDIFLSNTALFQVSVVALVGGAARSWGALVGGVIVAYLYHESGNLANGHAGLPDLTFALLFLMIALIMPRGISSTWALAASCMRRGRSISSGSVVLVNSAGSDVEGSSASERLPTVGSAGSTE